MKKLEILYTSKVISKATYENTKKIVFLLETMKLDDFETFIMHLAMANDRLEKNGEVKELEESIKNEIKNQKNFRKCKTFIDDNFKYLNKYNNYNIEWWYLMMHLLNILQ